MRPAVEVVPWPAPQKFEIPDPVNPGGPQLIIRAIRPEDEAFMVDFHKALSDETVYLRYFFPARLDWRANHEELAGICMNEWLRHLTLVIELPATSYSPLEIVAIGQLVMASDSRSAELALLVRDDFQRHGLGGRLLDRMITVAAEAGIDTITAMILPENHAMLGLCRVRGFGLEHSRAGDPIIARLDVRELPALLT